MDAPSTSQIVLNSSNENEVDEISLKCEYMNLLEEVEGTGTLNVQECIQKLNSVIDRANALLPKVKKPSQLYWDAKVMHSSAVTLEDTCNNVDVGEGTFKLFLFAEQLRAKSFDGTRCSWQAFASVAQPVIHNSLPSWSPLLGSFDFQADVPLSDRKEKKPRPQKERAAEKREPEKLKTVDKTQEGIAEIVQNIYAKLKSYYKRNGKKPVSYFKFVINPNSFASTVENIFHVSFLLNDGIVKMELDNDEPVIFPVSRGKENSNPDADRQSNERLQNILSMDMKMWKGLVAGMKLTEAII